VKAILEFDLEAEDALFAIARNAVEWYEVIQTYHDYLKLELATSKDSPRGKTLSKLLDVFDGLLKQHGLAFDWDLKDSND
jgi:hypothetical protein